jgi:type III pantothenate kinase
MIPDVVVDVGNTRIKWGLCRDRNLAAVASLPPDAPDEWEEQVRNWKLTTNSWWVLTGVHPARRDALKGWLQSCGYQVVVLNNWKDLPLHVALDQPERVGIDRLLDAVAACSRRNNKQPAIIVDAGSAVTVNWVDAAGAFRGGAILPGLRLMAEALHTFTAQLPRIEIQNLEPILPGGDTRSAMEAGIFWTVVGGVQLIIDRLAKLEQTEPAVFLTGGDGKRLSPFITRAHQVWPEMTLEGVRLAADAMS